MNFNPRFSLLLLLLLATLASCAEFPDYPLPYHYYSRCVQLDAEVPVTSQARLDAYIDRTAELYEQAFPHESWCELMGDHRIRLYDGPWWCNAYNNDTGGFGEYCDGYSSTGDVAIDVYEYALLHETLHVRDAAHADILTGLHEGWQQKGYWSIDHSLRESGVEAILPPPLHPRTGN